MLCYVLNWLIGWIYEISVLLWIWLVLFGVVFVVFDIEEMCFDLIYGVVGVCIWWIMVLIIGIVMVVVLVMVMFVIWDYVSFMWVELIVYLGILFNWVYVIYVIFVVVMIVWYLWIGFCVIYGKVFKVYDLMKVSFGV